ncbi:hypothetical protein L6R52_35530 [Myxococcota bacterium]|nr:hypothetical protein [Myxococcota bacterium]
MFTSSLVALVLFAAPPAPATFFPCTPGLVVEREVEPAASKDALASKPRRRVVDTIRGPGREKNSCVLDRVVRDPDGKERTEALGFEVLPDRVSNMGWIDQPLALRPPMLKAPVAKGAKWTFDRSIYEILDVDVVVTLPAGRLTGCVRVREVSRDGVHDVVLTYAPQIGLVERVSRNGTERAIVVTRPKGAKDRAEKGAKR